MNVKFSLLFVALATQPLWAQTEVQQVREDLSYLASDELAGREPGTRGAAAAEYFIIESFKDAGLTAIDDQWTQAFPIPVAVDYRIDGNALLIEGGREMESDDQVNVLMDEYSDSPNCFPVRSSADGEVNGSTAFVGYGITSLEMDHDDYADVDVNNKVAVIDVGSPDGVHPHSQYMKYHGLDYRIQNAADHGAIGVLFIHTTDMAQPPRSQYNSFVASALPAWFVGDDAAAEVLKTKSVDVHLSVNLRSKSVTGYNVIGYADRGSETTLVIGAHYDHLGYGVDNSLYRGVPAIHNGADDNASGTSGLLHLVRNATEIAPNHNLLFIAFSGEERGLIGSDYYSKNPTIDLNTVVAMLNMDMIGRLDTSKSLLLSGTGTAEEWDALIETANTTGLAISKSEGGTGASDHTSFYQMDIPVLHFFTGTHEDYHKPSDDADKINYEGLVEVANFLAAIANEIPESLTFQKTVEKNTATPRFNVTLGIIPDYIFGGPGVRVDGVTDGKPAGNAGVQTGDIITQLGEYPIGDIYAYMRALGAFKPGDNTTVTVKRGDEELTLDLTF